MQFLNPLWWWGKLKEAVCALLGGAILIFCMVVIAIVACNLTTCALDPGEDVEVVQNGACFTFEADEHKQEKGTSVVEIETAIVGPCWVVDDTKSCHRFTVDWNEGKCDVLDEYESTGKTWIFKGIRNQFSAKPVLGLKEPGCVIRATGQTASPICLLPSIDYRFYMKFGENGKVAFTGGHDGFPMYVIKVNGQEAYARTHECDGDDGCSPIEMLRQLPLLGNDLDVRANVTHEPAQED